MNTAGTTATRTVVVGAESGLHARPAKLVAQTAKSSGINVTVAKGDGKPANAASILGVMSIGAVQGDTVTFSATGDGAEELLDVLAGLVTTDQNTQ